MSEDVKKPREFSVTENRCTGDLNIYPNKEAMWDQMAPNDDEFEVQEVIDDGSIRVTREIYDK